MAHPPWSVLGLDGPADERGIRSAYARRLKAVRPEDDPAAFQALVEARAWAVTLARERAQRNASRPADAAAGDASERDGDGEQEGSAEETGGPVILATPPEAASSATGSGRSAVLAIELDPSATKEPATQDGCPASPAAIAIIDLAPPPVSGGTRDTAAGADAANETAVPEPAPDRHGAPAPEAHQWFPDELADELAAFLGAPDPPDVLRARAGELIRRFDHLSASDRAEIESETFRAATNDLHPLLMGLVEGRRQWLPSKSSPDMDRLRIRRDTILAVNEIFGWTENDRNLYDRLARSDVHLRLAQLRAAVQLVDAERGRLAPQFTAGGVPIVSASDLATVFGGEFAFYELRYQNALRLGYWPVDWQWRRFGYGILWAIGLKQGRGIALWLAAFGAMLAIHVALEQWVEPYFPGLDQGWTGTAAIAVSVLPIVAVHAYFAAYGSAMEINRAARRIHSADRRFLFEPRARTLFLQKGAPDFRVPKPKEEKSVFKSWWFWWGLFVLARLLFKAAGY